MQMCNSVSGAANAYEQSIRKEFEEEAPTFDLLILGMGPDGHICSLFPNDPLLDVKNLLVASISDSPKPPPQRITITLPVVLNAAHTAFLCMGASKAENVQRAIEGEVTKEIPASLVRNGSGQAHWFLDQAAAAKLS